MEEGLKPGTTGQTEMNAAEYSPLVLAYMGDAVYETVIRDMVVREGNRQVNKMHRETTALVKAGAQAKMIRLLEDRLLPDEHAVYKRGRNAKSNTMAKNATVIDYRMATAFEAVIGYLWLSGSTERMKELIRTGLELLKKEEGTHE